MLETSHTPEGVQDKSLSSHNKKSRHHKSAEEAGPAFSKTKREVVLPPMVQGSHLKAKTARVLEKSKKVWEKFDQRTTEILAEREKTKAKAEEVVEDANEPYTSYEVSEGEDLEKTEKDEKFKKVMTDLKGKLKRREKEREEETDKHDEIEEAAKRYFEVGGDELKQFLFDESWTKTRLTRKELESKPKEIKFLKKWFFGENNHRQTLEDFLAALPTEQDYIDNMVDKIGKSRSGLSGKIAKEVEEDSTLIKKTKKSDVGELEATPKVEMVGGNSLKKVVTAKEIFVPTEVRNQNEELLAVSGEIDTEVSRKKLLGEAVRRSAAKDVPFISPDNIEESRRLAEKDDAAYKAEAEAEFAPKTEKDFWAEEAQPSTLETARARVAAMPEANRKRAEAAPLAKKLSGMSTKEGVEHVSKEVKAGKQKLLDEIAARYLKKFDSKENVHKFLMGPEVKGWFKGGQRKDQENYKKLYNELHG